jgi:Fe-S oxidoreductase
MAGLGLPRLRAHRGAILVHEHCHARALGREGEVVALAGAIPEAEVRPSGAGCCGMAGAFGYRQPELSLRIAEDRLLPALKEEDLVVAEGTSCRAQLAELAGVRAVHPAELIAGALA